MIEKLKLVRSQQVQEKMVSLHPHITDILFEHRRYVKNVFLQIKGHYDIAYFSINIINPSNELVSFSSMPHIEYNLIQQGLWKHDRCFSRKGLSKNTLLCWDNINADNLFVDQIKEIKLTANHFSFGMSLLREIDGFSFLYSFATESNKTDLKKHYDAQIYNLIDIGDYFCTSVLNLYAEYCNGHSLPQLNKFNSKASDPDIRSVLKLVVNNL
ncbi:hypothetical protein ACFORL_09550 [Legionella dresdenensis]|uniref:FlgJ-like protein n=1 Tax=Legionella dresdenensis TaxID=450200 RepID=A0ABV8CGJ7_9GAMM